MPAGALKKKQKHIKNIIFALVDSLLFFAECWQASLQEQGLVHLEKGPV